MSMSQQSTVPVFWGGGAAFPALANQSDTPEKKGRGPQYPLWLSRARLDSRISRPFAASGVRQWRSPALPPAGLQARTPRGDSGDLASDRPGDQWPGVRVQIPEAEPTDPFPFALIGWRLVTLESPFDPVNFG